MAFHSFVSTSRFALLFLANPLAAEIRSEKRTTKNEKRTALFLAKQDLRPPDGHKGRKKSHEEIHG